MLCYHRNTTSRRTKGTPTWNMTHPHIVNGARQDGGDDLGGSIGRHGWIHWWSFVRGDEMDDPPDGQRVFQDRTETWSNVGNNVCNALESSIERGHLDELIGCCLARIFDTEDKILVKTNKVLQDRAFIAPVTRFVQHKTQKYYTS